MRFEQVARRAFDEIPDAFKEGIDGLVVAPQALTHPDFPDVFTLGECATESYPSDWVGPETLRSTVVVYWGSFRALAARDSSFDWEGELRETIEHEVRHHLEGLAGEDDLGDVDYATEQSFRRERGESWDPWYWQHGEEIAPGTYAVEDQRYIRVLYEADEAERRSFLTFRWRGKEYELPAPDELGELHFVTVVGGVIDPPTRLEVVLERRTGTWERLKGVFRKTSLSVLESTCEVRLVTKRRG